MSPFMHRVASPFALLLWLVAVSTPVRADQAAFALPLDKPGMVNLHLFIPYEATTPGLAHYTEHLVWLSSFGGGMRVGDPHSNASTSERAVVYDISGAPADLKANLERLARVFDPISLKESFAIEERGIVQREYDLRIGDTPAEKAFERMNAFLYEGNAEAVSVMGTPAEIGALSLEDAIAFQKATHRPERAMLMAEGDITQEQLETALADAKFPQLAPRSALVPTPFKGAAPGEMVIRDPDPKSAPRMLWSKLVQLPEPVPYDLLVFQGDLLTDILTSALEGGLSKALRYDAFVARTFEVKVMVHDERHVEFFVSAEPDAGVGFADLRQALEVALGRSSGGTPKATYDRVLKRFRAAVPPPTNRPLSLSRMADYAYRQLSQQRPMLDEQARRALLDQLDQPGNDRLVSSLASQGRVFVAFLGKDPAP